MPGRSQCASRERPRDPSCAVVATPSPTLACRALRKPRSALGGSRLRSRCLCTTRVVDEGAAPLSLLNAALRPSSSGFDGSSSDAVASGAFRDSSTRQRRTDFGTLLLHDQAPRGATGSVQGREKRCDGARTQLLARPLRLAADALLCFAASVVANRLRGRKLTYPTSAPLESSAYQKSGSVPSTDAAAFAPRETKLLLLREGVRP
jgi:hypothetical protein